MSLESQPGEQPEHPQPDITAPERPSPQGPRTTEQILDDYEPVTQGEIVHRLKALSSVGYHVGKDLEVKMGLTEPGSRLWYQDPVHNEIRADPQQLLEKDMDYLRFAMAHEGGHRRVTRDTGISPELMHQPGFAFLFNAVEDPRNNNFILEGYPVLQQNVRHIYEHELGFGESVATQAADTLGQTPRFTLAGQEYIKQWMRDQRGEPIEVDPNLPADVREVVEKTVAAAQSRWWTYPSKAEADGGEATIQAYAASANALLKERIWPEYQKLVAADQQEQMAADACNDMAEQARSGESNGSNAIDVAQLSPEEREELEKAIEAALDRAQAESSTGEAGRPVVNFDELSDELKQKIKKHLETLSPEEKAARAQAAAERLSDFEQRAIAEHEGVEGGHLEEVVQGKEAHRHEEPEKPVESPPSPAGPAVERDPEQEARLKEIRAAIERLSTAQTPYEKARQAVAPTIDRITNELEDIFVARRERGWTSGHRRGSRFDVARRMREKGRGVSAADSRAWERRHAPTEKDYAFLFLVDLSGSMVEGLKENVDYSRDKPEDTKIHETFKALIATTEPLDRLKVPTEIIGFNTKLHPYKQFDQPLDTTIRSDISAMLGEVVSSASGGNDDGWAVQTASQHLAARAAQEKYLIVLSDGQPIPSKAHAGPEYNLKTVVQGITRDSDQTVIGLGIQSEAVKRYYDNALVEQDAHNLSLRLAELIRDIVENPDKYKVR